MNIENLKTKNMQITLRVEEATVLIALLNRVASGIKIDNDSDAKTVLKLTVIQDKLNDALSEKVVELAGKASA